MNNSNFIESIKTDANHLDAIIDSVIDRGYDDEILDSDDYSILIQQKEFRDAISIGIYEEYFLPKRHEFEFQIINHIVDTVWHNSVGHFAIEALTGGIIGNASYQVVTILLKRTVDKFGTHDKIRSKPFVKIHTDIKKIAKYFKDKEKVHIEVIESDLNISRVRLIPLLKLLGFKCRRRNKNDYWIKPK